VMMSRWRSTGWCRHSLKPSRNGSSCVGIPKAHFEMA
jgi:hypothetical protein